MKTFNKMQTFINIVTICLVVLLALQIALLFLPFFEQRTLAPTYWNNYDPQPEDFSMMDYAFFKTVELRYVMKAEVKEVFGDAKYYSNNYVMGIVWIFTFAAIGVVSNIVARKSIFTEIVSVLFVIFSLTGGFFSQILTLPNTAQWICTVGKILSILSSALILARLYPWFVTKFMKKKLIEKEKQAIEA